MARKEIFLSVPLLLFCVLKALIMNTTVGT